MNLTSALLAIILCLSSFLTTTNAHADDTSPPPSMLFSEFQTATTGAGTTNSVGALGMKFYTPHLGAWIWAQAAPTWGEAYAGPLFAITPEIQLGVAAGFETNTPAWRVGYIAGYYTGDHYAEVFGEYGGSGYWLRVHGNYQVNSWFGIGIHGESDHGVGPRVRLRLPPDTMPYPLELWGAPLFDWNGDGAVGSYLNWIAGVRINM